MSVKRKVPGFEEVRPQTVFESGGEQGDDISDSCLPITGRFLRSTLDRLPRATGHHGVANQPIGGNDCQPSIRSDRYRPIAASVIRAPAASVAPAEYSR